MLYQLSMFMRPGEGISAKAHAHENGVNHWVAVWSNSGNAVIHVADAYAATKLAALIKEITRAPAQMQEAA
jgi:hypothetical protein